MAEGKFVISAQNRIKEGLDAAQRDLGSFTTAAENLGKKLEAAFTATAIVAGLKKLGEATFDCYKEFGEAERRLNTLKIALDNNDASIRRATGLIENMSKMTLASKDDIEALVSELAALGKSDDEIEAITRASINLSNVTGKDLNSAFTLVNATYSGTAGKLDKLLPQIGDLTKEQLAAGGATKLINERFGELSQTIASNDISQNLKNLSDSFGDLKENIGGQTASFFAPVVAGIQSIVTAWNNAFQAQEDYKKNALTIKDVETKSEGERLQAALANAVRDRETALRAFNMAQLTTEGAYKIIGGKKEPIYTPETAQQAGAFGDLTSQYFKFNALAASFRLSFENFKAENPNWNTIRTTTTGGIPLGIGGGGKAWSYNELYGAYKLGSGVMGQSGIPGRIGTNIPLQNLNIRDDLESYGWNAAMLAKPVIEFRDDLESYGWEGLAETAFDRFKKQWAKSVDEGLRPEEGGAYSPNYAAQAVREDIAETFQYWERVSKDFRDDLESYDWEGLVERILPTDGGGFRVQGQSGISGPIGGGGLSPAAQIASNTGILDTISQALRGSLTTVMSGMTSFTSAISGSLGTIMSALGPFGNMIAGMNPALALLIPVIDGFAQIMGPVLTATLEPVIGALTAVGTILAQALLPVFDALYPIINTIAEIFMVALSPVLSILAAQFAILGTVIELFSPILSLLAKAFVILTSPIEFVADLLVWVGGHIKAFGENVGIALWNVTHPFNQRDYTNGPGGLTSDAFTGLGDRLNRIDSLMNTKATFTERGGATSTASESASYRTQSITINIYQNAAVVGQAGMTEFARIIRGEFVQLGYLGQ